ncbi:YihA family ribosome biogenesis GTP-binding protein [Paenibacillus mesophilus]|uniref:ribosome biogenesis GTP-binding protein YihA/YsxC n=1 Tax=Paenibacillus mesophilus TaxID=2582849 RepID=UPI00110E9674|nr:ribosome biogenesis GTP-binding protein YihA/YsxC [Paenibacillus mesophilus]TMV52945.1 YihA family ribosome biogenesis GTP-binding protein [Paenibacillus mesophilus]
MKVTQAEFIISAVGPDQYPDDGLPEIALAGRSNVGKSSLINKMIQRKNLARTSSQPGKTQTLNFYKINEELYFVDLPGYGYAKVSMAQRQEWGKFIESYLLKRDRLRMVILLVDVRHPPTRDDVSMYDWLGHYGIPICVVATKADKVPRSRWQKHLKQVKETLLVRGTDSVILFSSETGLGKDELWSLITAQTGKQLQEGIEAD